MVDESFSSFSTAGGGEYNNFQMQKIRVPEDPPHKVPRRYVRYTMCNSVLFFFPTISSPFSHNLDRVIGSRRRFFELYPGYIVPGLFPKISSKKKIDLEHFL
jgi:hypothetical protein